jgi:hypothetical protein
MHHQVQQFGYVRLEWAGFRSNVGRVRHGGLSCPPVNLAAGQMAWAAAAFKFGKNKDGRWIDMPGPALSPPINEGGMGAG